MRRRASGHIRLTAWLAAILALAGCGSTVGAAGAEVDTATARRLMCQSGVSWATGDATVQRTLRPSLQRLIDTYQGNANPGVALMAGRLDDALNASEATKGVAVAALRSQCR